MQTITKTVDEMGRVMLPTPMRTALDLGVGAPVQITMKDDEIIIKKQNASCTFCGCEETIAELNGKCICAHCRELLCSKKGV